MKTRNSKLSLSQNLLTILMVLVIYAVVFVLIYTGQASRQLTNMLISSSCYIVMAVSLNLVVGMLGELSLGHACFMSIGLFSGCLLSITLLQRFPVIPFAVRLIVSMIFGGLFASAFGFIIGLPALRLNGDYLAIVTLACGEIIKTIITNMTITGGARGLETGAIYQNSKTLLPYAFGLVLLTIVLIINLQNSKYGRAIMAIRDNNIAAESVGINLTYYKLSVFVLAAFFAGAAGTLYGHNFANIKATTFDYNMSIEFLLIVVLGGMGSIRGSLIAAILLKALPELLRDFNDYRMLAYSVLLILIMLFNSAPKFNQYKTAFRNLFHLNKMSKSEGKED